MKRLSLRAMLLGTAAIAVALVACILIKDRLETKSLAACIVEANAVAARDPIGKLSPPLNEAEVYRWLGGYLAAADQPASVKWRCKRILRSGRLPPQARIRGEVVHCVPHGWLTTKRRKEWNFRLEIEHGERHFVGIDIMRDRLSRGVDWAALAQVREFALNFGDFGVGIGRKSNGGGGRVGCGLCSEDLVR